MVLYPHWLAFGSGSLEAVARSFTWFSVLNGLLPLVVLFSGWLAIPNGSLLSLARYRLRTRASIAWLGGTVRYSHKQSR